MEHVPAVELPDLVTRGHLLEADGAVFLLARLHDVALQVLLDFGRRGAFRLGGGLVEREQHLVVVLVEVAVDEHQRGERIQALLLLLLLLVMKGAKAPREEAEEAAYRHRRRAEGRHWRVLLRYTRVRLLLRPAAAPPGSRIRHRRRAGGQVVPQRSVRGPRGTAVLLELQLPRKRLVAQVLRIAHGRARPARRFLFAIIPTAIAPHGRVVVDVVRQFDLRRLLEERTVRRVRIRWWRRVAQVRARGPVHRGRVQR